MRHPMRYPFDRCAPETCRESPSRVRVPSATPMRKTASDQFRGGFLVGCVALPSPTSLSLPRFGCQSGGMQSPRSGFRRAAVASWALAGMGIAGVAGASALAYADTVKPAAAEAPAAADLSAPETVVGIAPEPTLVAPVAEATPELPVPPVAPKPTVRQAPAQVYIPAPTYAPAPTYVPQQAYAPAPVVQQQAPVVQQQAPISAPAAGSQSGGSSSSSGVSRSTSTTRQNRPPMGGGSSGNKFTPPHTTSKGS